MNHQITEEELNILKHIDFVVPLKKVGHITRAVLESIRSFYKPRRIIVVTSYNEVYLLNKLLPYWNVGTVESIPEEEFFMPILNLRLSDILAEYDDTRPGDKREPGWWIQQLIKLGAATQIKDISSTYIVWDGDLIPTRRWKLCDRDENGEIRYYIAILQGESRSEFNVTQYASCMRESTGFEPLDPKCGGTFVTHHMVFQKQYVRELLDLMTQKMSSKIAWPLMIMSLSKKYYRFSEYKTYSTFMMRYHHDRFHYHVYKDFGEGGIRFRDANNVIDEMRSNCNAKGMSYEYVKDFVASKWRSMSNESVSPAYIQLDHVYGFDCSDVDAIVAYEASRFKRMDSPDVVVYISDEEEDHVPKRIRSCYASL